MWVSGGGAVGSNTAVTSLLEFIVMDAGFAAEPASSPPQPTNWNPGAGEAVRLTSCPKG